jgi:hypothetical protein
MSLGLRRAPKARKFFSSGSGSRAKGDQMHVLFDLAVIGGWTIAVYVVAHFY